MNTIDDLVSSLNDAKSLRQNYCALARYARKMFELSGWPEGGDIDGFSLQEAAIECGLLVPEARYAPCGENCFCSEYHGDMSKGVTCFRKTAVLLDDNQ